MSSLQENSTVPLEVVQKRKTPFTRSDSFDKIQYTAFYTLQLAGTLLSQKSLLQVLDEVQYKSRVIIEKYAVDTVWPTFKMMYAVILLWIDAFARYTKINGIFEKKAPLNINVEPEKTYCLRVQKRKESLSMAKDLSTATADPIDEKRVKLLAEFDAVHPLHLRGNNSLVKSWKSDSDSEMGSNNSISTRQNIGMVVIVYGSATLVYIQLMFLAAFLQTAMWPPGLVFLVSCVFGIAYIVFKMGFAKNKSKDELSSTNKNRSASTSTTPAEDTVGELPVKQRNNGRLSRSSTRRFLYFHNKTLSKIKLL